jgi:hypothetical protein
MPRLRLVRRLLAALFVVSFCPASGLVRTAAAQTPSMHGPYDTVSSPMRNNRLLVPTIAASAAAAADWFSTHHALSNYRVRETNPLLRPFEQRPGQLVTVGAIMDGVAFGAWNLTVGQKHPKVAAAGLWGMAAFRTFLAIHNIRNTRRAEPR